MAGVGRVCDTSRLARASWPVSFLSRFSYGHGQISRLVFNEGLTSTFRLQLFCASRTKKCESILIYLYPSKACDVSEDEGKCEP